MKPPPTEDGFYSIEGLARVLSRDRRSVIRALKGVKPDRIRGHWHEFKLENVIDRLSGKSETGDLKSQKLLEEIRKLKLANDTRDKLLIARKLIAAEWIRVFATALKEVEHKLVNEYPTVVAGIGVPEARVYGKRVMDFILAAHKEAAEKWED